MSKNTEIWDQVSVTPPEMTKDVRFGKRHYTTIDPQWQLLEATKLWGPYGHKWGLRNIDWTIVETNEVDRESPYKLSAIVLKAEFFYPLDDGKEVSFEIMNDDRFRANEECLKKLVTNTRSKALSWVGFSADVFMGKFDDLGYVRDLETRFGDQNKLVTAVMAKVKTAKDAGELDKYRERLKKMIVEKTIDNAALGRELLDAVDDREQELSMLDS